MKYGVLGDIHANLSALEVALQALSDAGVDQILSVGDIVGYGAAPRECIKLLIERRVKIVKGNHDAAVVGELDPVYFNPHARAAVEWTRTVLGSREIAWLKDLPLVIQEPHCCVAHGTLHNPDRFEYIQTPQDADPSFDELTLPVCFVGHTHFPVTLLRLTDDPLRTAYTYETSFDLSEASKALVNVGSVGQPRDEDPRTAYVIYNSETREVHLHRAEYDIECEARRIRAAGLPDILADRLYLGV